MPKLTTLIGFDEKLDERCQKHGESPDNYEWAQLTFDETANRIYVSSHDYTETLVIDGASLEVVSRLPLPVPGSARVMTADGRTLYASDEGVWLQDMSSGDSKFFKFEAEAEYVTPVSGQAVVGAYSGETAHVFNMDGEHLYDVNFEEEIRTSRDGTDVESCFFCRDLMVVASGKELIVFDEDGDLDYSIRLHKAGAHFYGSNDHKASPDGQFVAEVREDGCGVYDFDSGEVVAFNDEVSGDSMRFVDSSNIVTWSQTSGVVWWNWRENTVQKAGVPWQGHNHIHVFADGTQGFSVSTFTQFCLWDLKRYEGAQIASRNATSGFIVSPDASNGVVFRNVAGSCKIETLNLQDGSTNEFATVPSDFKDAYWLDDSTFCVASGGWDYITHINVMKVGTSAPQRSFEGKVIAFSDTGFVVYDEESEGANIIAYHPETLERTGTELSVLEGWFRHNEASRADWFYGQDDDHDDAMVCTKNGQTFKVGDEMWREGNIIVSKNWDDEVFIHRVSDTGFEQLLKKEIAEVYEVVVLTALEGAFFTRYDEKPSLLLASGDIVEVPLPMPEGYDPDDDLTIMMMQLTNGRGLFVLDERNRVFVLNLETREYGEAGSFNVNPAYRYFSNNHLIAEDYHGLFEVLRLEE